MQDQFRRTALAVGFEGDLSIDNLVKVVAVAFRKYLGLALPGGLGEKMSVFASHGQDEVRRQLITAHITVEQFRVDGNLLALLRRLRLDQRALRVHQMQAD